MRGKKSMIPGSGSREKVLMRRRTVVAFDYRLGIHTAVHKEEKMQKRVAILTEVGAKMDRCLSSLAVAFAPSRSPLAADSLLNQ